MTHTSLPNTHLSGSNCAQNTLNVPITAQYALCFIMLLAVCANLGPIVFGEYPRAHAIDFNYYWGAGKLWREGLSPYSPAFIEIMAPFSGLHHRPNGLGAQFFYAPNAIILFMPLGFFDTITATKIMSGVNGAIFFSTCWLFMRNAQSLNWTLPKPILFSLHAFILGVCVQATEVAFTQNTLTLMIYMGALLIIAGILEKRMSLVTLGLVLCFMQPQLGILLFGALFLMHPTRKSAFIAASITFLLLLIGLLPGGIIAPFFEFLHNVSSYAHHQENAPDRMSGVGFFFVHIISIEISSFIFLLAACGFVLLISHHLLKAPNHTWLLNTPDPRIQMNLVIITIISSLFFMPSHIQYYLILAPLALALPRLPSSFRLFLILGMGIHSMSRVLSVLLAKAEIGGKNTITDPDAGLPSDFANFHSGLPDSIAITICIVTFSLYLLKYQNPSKASHDDHAI